MRARPLVDEAGTIKFDQVAFAYETRTDLPAITNVTTLVIAHQLSTVQRADIICVRDAGGIIEVGNYPELLAQNAAHAASVALRC